MRFDPLGPVGRPLGYRRRSPEIVRRGCDPSQPLIGLSAHVAASDSGGLGWPEDSRSVSRSSLPSSRGGLIDGQEGRRIVPSTRNDASVSATSASKLRPPIGAVRTSTWSRCHRPWSMSSGDDPSSRRRSMASNSWTSRSRIRSRMTRLARGLNERRPSGFAVSARARSLGDGSQPFESVWRPLLRDDR